MLSTLYSYVYDMFSFQGNFYTITESMSLIVTYCYALLVLGFPIFLIYSIFKLVSRGDI